jgi:hypothetical protein
MYTSITERVFYYGAIFRSARFQKKTNSPILRYVYELTQQLRLRSYGTLACYYRPRYFRLTLERPILLFLKNHYNRLDDPS